MNPIPGAWYDRHAGLWLMPCDRCGVVKTQLAFRIDRKYARGFDPVCKTCRAEEGKKKS